MGARLKICVVGTGFGARIHVPGLRASGRFDVVALVGRDPGRLATAARRCGVERTCATLAEALDIPGLDAVSIATPPMAHAVDAIAAARAGKHVLCEKPMARTLVEAIAMREAARGRVALVDHEFRFDPARRLLGRLIADGTVGTPHLVTAITTMPHFIDPWRPPPPWWFDADAGGGWLGACGSHVIDALRVWLGDVAALTATVATAAPRPAGLDAGPQADDTYTILFRTVRGAHGVLQQSAATWGRRFEALRIAGTRATAWIDDAGALWTGDADTPASAEPIPDDLTLPRVPVAPWMGPFAHRELPSFTQLARRFADLIEGRTIDAEERPATFDDGVAVQAIMDAARAAARERTWIVPDVARSTA